MSTKQEKGLIGYWKLKGDCKDYSGKGNHGKNYGVNLVDSAFNGGNSCIEVEHNDLLNFGKNNFSISTWVYTEKDLLDVIGDIVSKYDSLKRKGFTFNVKSSSGGYNSQGNDKHVYFGIDNARMSAWQDCGRPSKTSNYVSNSLTVFNGKLYAGITDAKREEDWCHVYYYEGNKQWRDCGQPGKNLRLAAIASYKGRLYVVGDDGSKTEGPYKGFVYDGGEKWHIWGEFGTSFPHSIGIHDGKLYVGCVLDGAVYSYNGEKWEHVGNPLGCIKHCTQVHSLEVYRGELYAGTWPEGRVAMYERGKNWGDCGRLGDSTEINALVVYNGKLYGGSIPRAEVFRYEEDSQWMPIKCFFAPEGWEPASVDSADRKVLNEWTRVTSLTVFDGRLFASIGSCTSSILDAPCDVRGKVYSMEAGKCVSYDYDLGSGWKHLVAVRDGNKLKLYINSELQATSSFFNPEEYDISNNEPLKIGFGEIDYFSGKICQVRIYNRALKDEEIRDIAKEGK